MINFNYVLSKINDKCSNKLISGFLDFKFKYIEKKKLNYARKKYRHLDFFNNPLISIYIPTFNRASILINKSLPSLLKQTYNNIEIIIIGDRCTDNTEDELKKFNDKRIKFKNISYKYKPMPKHENYLWLAGEVLAANYALRKARGLWIARLDDDEEWIQNNHIQTMLEFAKEKNSEFISAPNLYNDEIIYGQKALSDYYLTKKIKVKNISSSTLIGGHSTFFYKSYLKLFKYNSQCWRKKWNKVNDADLVNRLVYADVKMNYLNFPMTKINKINTPSEIRQEFN